MSGTQATPQGTPSVLPDDVPEPLPPSAPPAGVLVGAGLDLDHPAAAHLPQATASPGRREHAVRPVRAGLSGGRPLRPAVEPYGTPADAAEPVVRITIDRLEVRAAPQPASPARPPRRQPRLGLDEYLRGRS
ncbi:hypothetical protein [Streptomyces sp. NPDC002553]|uniref:hypothetical protein n=1 Tax=Streptomyces sp. NPDC002553 TaxID=3154417 RepID=UPI00332EDB41